jgi:hypothetical protein
MRAPSGENSAFRTGELGNACENLTGERKSNLTTSLPVLVSYLHISSESMVLVTSLVPSGQTEIRLTTFMRAYSSPLASHKALAQLEQFCTDCG